MSLHPPHMADSTGTLLPAALIPFCSYQASFLGVHSPNLPFVSCSQAQPTVLDGQLCYSINASHSFSKVSKNGRENGLLMLLDFGPLRSQQGQEAMNENKEVWTKGMPLNTEMSDEDKTSVRVYVQTLSEFSSYGEGGFAMSELKRMTGRPNFLEFPDSLKKCQIEARDKCRILKYFERVQDQCGCVPWALADFQAVKPGVTPGVQDSTHHPQVSFCTLESEECMEEVAHSPADCLVSCDGLYADIQHVRDSSNTGGAQLASIIKQYNMHKELFARNIFFDPEVESLSE